MVSYFVRLDRNLMDDFDFCFWKNYLCLFCFALFFFLIFGLNIPNVITERMCSKTLTKV